MEFQFGELLINITVKHIKRHVETDDESGAEWSHYTGSAIVAWYDSYGGRLSTIGQKVAVDCWGDEHDPQFADWNEANEGARVLNSLLGVEENYDTRGDFIREAFPRLCQEIGDYICEAMRATYQED